MIWRILLANTPPPTFRTSKVIKKFEDKIDLELKGDASARRWKINNTDELITYLEERLNRNNQYKLLYPYYDWMYVKYAQGNLQMVEDLLSKVIPALVTYHDMKNRGKLESNERDIMQIKDIDALLTITERMKGKAPKLSRKQMMKKLIDSKQLLIRHNDAKYQIVVPKTKLASCFWGVNTRWCTAAKSGNMFGDYTRGGRGILYYMLDKRKNKRFAFYFQHNRNKPKRLDTAKMTIFNERDKEVDSKKIVKEYPFLYGFFRSRVEFGLELKTPKDIMRQLEHNPNYIDHVPNPTKEMLFHAVKHGASLRLIDNPPPEIVEQAIRNKPYNIKYVDKPSEKLQLIAIEKEADIILEIKNPTDKAISLAISRDYDILNDLYYQGIPKEKALIAFKADPRSVIFMVNESYMTTEMLEKGLAAFLKQTATPYESIEYMDEILDIFEDKKKKIPPKVQKLIIDRNYKHVKRFDWYLTQDILNYALDKAKSKTNKLNILDDIAQDIVDLEKIPDFFWHTFIKHNLSMALDYVHNIPERILMEVIEKSPQSIMLMDNLDDKIEEPLLIRALELKPVLVKQFLDDHQDPRDYDNYSPRAAKALLEARQKLKKK